MKWLLLVVLFGVDGNKHYDPTPFASENECIAAAQEFVKQHPAFEWRDHRPSNTAFNLVVRSYVKCEPEALMPPKGGKP
ncbi:MAG: hypothetical protein QF797_04360 [Alphaproteobacteria bacterium]|jgi:hypothetical protein|nr:hypothetical protein [Alphaproteobacteria bacterium]MDP6623759.1 hypothetical protein [Alphaproteobacteria bacterium]|tara:strand:- start:176 stop:412 length:237 start_codon:yes stop_codon:yes gene_type:complete